MIFVIILVLEEIAKIDSPRIVVLAAHEILGYGQDDFLRRTFAFVIDLENRIDRAYGIGSAAIKFECTVTTDVSFVHGVIATC